MPTIAVPNWNGRISPVFDVAGELVVEEMRTGERSVEPLAGSLIFQRVEDLQRLGIDVLICGGISNPLRGAIEGTGIRVMPWMSGSVDDVLEAYRTGSLRNGRFAMPGRRRRRGPRYRGGRGT